MKKCTVIGCPGLYEPKLVAEVYDHKGEKVLVEGIPAEVCAVCGDALTKPEVVDGIRAALERPPTRTARVHSYELAG